MQMTQSMHFVANFRRGEYTITTETPEKMGSVEGGGIYLGLDTAVLLAVPENGYIFSHWHDSVTDNPRRVVVIQDSVFMAYFVEDTSAIDTSTGGADTITLAVEASPDGLFTLSPNPATGTVTVTVGILNSPMVLTLTDAAGREVLRKEFSIVNCQFSIPLDLSGLPAGTYFVTLTTPTATGTQRLVVR
ncbi:MAG: T9SS type A sorting domain-containing protein [Bacteroidales bacterium]|nr:T9SS type A sorting domain-containing protein [Bacteroidales bacterium]